MASVSDVVEEIRGIEMMLKSRSDGGTACTPEYMRKLASSMASKCTHLNFLDPNAAKMLYDAVNVSGYDKDGKAAITAAIDAQYEKQLDEEPKAKASKRNQLLLKPLPWVTEGLMVTIRKANTTIDVKLQVCSEYLANKLGCQYPHERTYRFWLCLVLMSHFTKWPKYKVIYQYLLDMSNIWYMRSIIIKCDQ